MDTFPERALASLNAALTWLADAALAPLVHAAPLTTLLGLSVATGLAMLWVVGRTSNQAGIAAAKRGIQASLFEIRLFNDDLAAVMRALGRVLWQNARYLGFSLVPLAWVALPLTLVIAQLQAFYGYDGLRVGQPALLTLRWNAGAAVPAAEAIRLEAAGGLRADTPPVVVPGAGEVIWRLVPDAPGDYTVTAHIGGETFTKTVQVATDTVRRSPLRGRGLIDVLLYPSEPPLSARGPVSVIEVPYSEPGVQVLGWRVHWLIVYVAASMAVAFALAKKMGVTL